jgi:XRE family transcriptional regulator, master regulator for biofilm formation
MIGTCASIVNYEERSHHTFSTVNTFGEAGPTPDVLGARLQQVRELHGLSVSRVAADANVAKSYLAKLERGEVSNPGLATIAAVAAALGTTLVDLFAPTTTSHLRPRWSATVDPLELEWLRAQLPTSLTHFLEELEQEEGHVPADVVRSLGMIQFRGKRPASVADWRFLYLAMERSVH